MVRYTDPRGSMAKRPCVSTALKSPLSAVQRRFPVIPPPVCSMNHAGFERHGLYLGVAHKIGVSCPVASALSRRYTCNRKDGGLRSAKNGSNCGYVMARIPSIFEDVHKAIFCVKAHPLFEDCSALERTGISHIYTSAYVSRAAVSLPLCGARAIFFIQIVRPVLSCVNSGRCLEVKH